MTQANKIRVLVVHDDPLAREGLSALFGRHDDLLVVDAGAAPDHALGLLAADAAATIDVVVADYDHGVELAAQASRRVWHGSARPVGVVVVTSNNREWDIRSALERGVRGYILVSVALDEIADGVRSVHHGVRHLSHEVAARLPEILTCDALTGREEEVLRLVAEGLGNKAIARRLGIAVGTVKSHLKGIFEKLDVQSRTQAICSAERRGLLRQVSKAAPTTARPQSHTYSHDARAHGRQRTAAATALVGL